MVRHRELNRIQQWCWLYTISSTAGPTFVSTPSLYGMPTACSVGERCIHGLSDELYIYTVPICQTSVQGNDSLPPQDVDNLLISTYIHFPILVILQQS